MRELLLLRHAKSDWEHEGIRDHDRDLNDRGRRSAPRVGHFLRDQGLAPDAVLCSTALRAVRTAELLLESAEYDVPLTRIEELYLAAPQVLVDTIAHRGGDAQRVLLVAHNPGLEELVTSWRRALTPFPTAALARVQLQIDDWSELQLGSPNEVLSVTLVRDLKD